MLLKIILLFGLFARTFATIYRNDVDRDHYQANSKCKAFSHLPQHKNRCAILYNEEFCYHNPGKWEPVEIEIGGIYDFPNPTKIESFYKRKGCTMTFYYKNGDQKGSCQWKPTGNKDNYAEDINNMDDLSKKCSQTVEKVKCYCGPTTTTEDVLQPLD